MEDSTSPLLDYGDLTQAEYDSCPTIVKHHLTSGFALYAKPQLKNTVKRKYSVPCDAKVSFTIGNVRNLWKPGNWQRKTLQLRPKSRNCFMCSKAITIGKLTCTPLCRMAKLEYERGGVVAREVVYFNCENCNKLTTRSVKTGRVHRFCSKRCVNLKRFGHG
jgi:hypothetical protein